MTTDFQLLPAEGALAYTVDFSAELAGGALLASVAWSVSPQRTEASSPVVVHPTLGTQSDNLAEGQSTVVVSNGEHQAMYVLQAIGVTSTGERIPKDVSILCLNA